MITIHNLRVEEFNYYDPTSVKCDRSSVLGNHPFPITKYDTRDMVCDSYDSYLREMIKQENKVITTELERLLSIYKKYGKLKLYCWCTPMRCHVETIVKYLEYRIRTDTQ